MMNMDIDCNLAKELLTYLYYFDPTFIDKIPDDVISNYTNLAADSDIEYSIIKDKPLLEQNMSLECKNLISSLYIKYIDDKDIDNLIINSD